MSKLILSVADNYNYYQLSRFIVSLRKTNYDGHVCIYVGPNTGKQTLNKLRSFGVELINFQDTFPYIKQPHPDNVSSLPNPIHLYNYRFYLYYDYLLKHPGRYQQIMLTDIRDVVFQKDPFDFDMGTAICVAMENPNIPLSECAYNKKWLLAGFDEDVLHKYGDQIISCSGTTFAPEDLMKKYLLLMLQNIQQVKDAYNCGDQAIHNVLIHSNQLSPLKKLDNDSGPVLTLGSEQYTISEDGLVLNKKGAIVNVVHQYDRHYELSKLFDKKTFPLPLQRWATKKFYKHFP